MSRRPIAQLRKHFDGGSELGGVHERQLERIGGDGAEAPPDCEGILVNSAASFHSVVIPCEDSYLACDDASCGFVRSARLGT